MKSRARLSLSSWFPQVQTRAMFFNKKKRKKITLHSLGLVWDIKILCLGWIQVFFKETAMLRRCRRVVKEIKVINSVDIVN